VTEYPHVPDPESGGASASEAADGTGSEPRGATADGSEPAAESPTSEAASQTPQGGYHNLANYPQQSGQAQPPSYGQQPSYGHQPTYGGYGQPQYGTPYGAPYRASGNQPTAAWQPTPAPAQPASKRHATRTVLLAAATAALVGAGVGAGTVALTDNTTTSSSSAGLAVTTQTAPNTAKTDGTITAAANKIQPSVVTINVRGTQAAGTGSGVIIRSDGYILTNNHVVTAGGTGATLTVVANDGQQGTARVIGTDALDDLAVIKVDGLSNLTAATFGKSSQLVVGQTVVAVGAPLGLSDTVTAGIVSNTARPVTTGDTQNTEAVFNAVQTDAAINPGNSGGPLVDLNGNVVGINAAIATASSGGLNIPGQQQESGSIGIGFAIPSDEAGRIANELITTGKATHAVLGVTPGALTQANATGALIAQLTPNGPAAGAGLKAGDIITAIDGQRLDDPVALVAAVRSHAPGDTVTVTYQRNGQTQKVQVKLGSASS
jgi:putative serine protease PepD